PAIVLAASAQSELVIGLGALTHIVAKVLHCHFAACRPAPVRVLLGQRRHIYGSHQRRIATPRQKKQRKGKDAFLEHSHRTTSILGLIRIWPFRPAGFYPVGGKAREWTFILQK